MDMIRLVSLQKFLEVVKGVQLFVGEQRDIVTLQGKPNSLYLYVVPVRFNDCDLYVIVKVMSHSFTYIYLQFILVRKYNMGVSDEVYFSQRSTLPPFRCNGSNENKKMVVH